MANGLTFWDTVRGHALADTLIRTLPKLTVKKEQYFVKGKEEDFEEIVAEEFKKGSRYVGHHVHNWSKEVVIIFEK